jgi:DNA (cytosine-5)-methyltransferase 1
VESISHYLWQPEANDLSVLDICTGAGGEALGLESVGFTNVTAVEIDTQACQTLRLNRPAWKVIEGDVRDIDANQFRGVDLLAGGVPCPPFTVAGKQLGPDDERNLFPEMLRLVEQVRPTAVMIENVPGFASAKFDSYRNEFIDKLGSFDYEVQWTILNSANFGVPQLRPRFVLVALRNPYAQSFHWPAPQQASFTVGQAIGDLMMSRGWQGASQWSEKATSVAPTLVGGSKKHGGPDLGPTRARQQWKMLGVDGLGIADMPPGEDFPVDGFPRLTLRMAARIQAFPDSWQFAGGKTAAYRQIGNAFPPPVAASVASSIVAALRGKAAERHESERPLRQMSLFHQDTFLPIYHNSNY